MNPWNRKIALLTVFLCLFFCGAVRAEDDVAWYENLSKEKKAILLNSAAGVAMLTWGVLTWDYGERGPHFKVEGWFEKDTEEGGADKVGHAYTGYALSHLFYYQYQRWGYDREQAIQLGCLSSFAITALMEVGDSFSDYGFSFQDGLFNIIGVAMGYGMIRFPEVARKVDFRVEYDPFRGGKYKNDVWTDYERLKYLFAIKLDGFDIFRDTNLKYFEIHAGYYARGYRDYDEITGEHDHRRQKGYVGVGLNVGKLLAPLWKTKVFNYIQIPYTYAPISFELN